MANYSPLNRGEIRRSAGINAGCVVIGTAKSTVDTTSLIDTYGLRGGDDEHNGKEVMIYDATGSIVDGEKSRVSDYAGATSDATVSPAFTANITTGDKYEMWDDWIFNGITEVNDLISQAVVRIADRVYVDKVTATTYSERDKLEYAVLSGFSAVHKVEYARTVKEIDTIADAVWTGAADVTATQDSVLYRGHNCTKLAVGDGVAAAAQIGYVASAIADYSNYDTVEIWIRSDIAQTATNLELRLCSDALGVTAVDTMSLPALTIDTWTRIQLTLTNPELDTAILSIALYQKAATDIGACNIWVEWGRALKATSRKFEVLDARYWDIVKGSTNYLKLVGPGHSVVGNDNLIRITGYQMPTVPSDDATDLDISPDYVIDQVSSELCFKHGNDSRSKERAAYYAGKAEAVRRRMTTSLMPDTRFI